MFLLVLHSEKMTYSQYKYRETFCDSAHQVEQLDAKVCLTKVLPLKLNVFWNYYKVCNSYVTVVSNLINCSHKVILSFNESSSVDRTLWDIRK
jgi:hypothetical protein